jgi:hypothetical protein
MTRGLRAETRNFSIMKVNLVSAQSRYNQSRELPRLGWREKREGKKGGEKKGKKE